MSKEAQAELDRRNKEDKEIQAAQMKEKESKPATDERS